MVEETSEPLFIRLYLDEDVHKAVAPALEARGFDAVGVHDLRHYGRSDAEHLAYAAAEGRAVFTFNAPDYIALHKRYLSEGTGRTLASSSPSNTLSAKRCVAYWIYSIVSQAMR